MVIFKSFENFCFFIYCVVICASVVAVVITMLGSLLDKRRRDKDETEEEKL